MAHAHIFRTSRLLMVLAVVGAVSIAAVGQTAPRGGAPGSTTTTASGDNLFNGVTEPFAKVDVPSATHGILAEVFVKEGQPVKAGDRLAKLDDTVQAQQVELAKLKAEQSSEIENAKNNITFAENELTRLKKAGGSASEVQQKELAVQTAKLGLAVHLDEQKQNQVRLQQENITLDRMTMKSPIDGFVFRTHKQAGEMTDEGPVITVVQTTKLNALFFLPKALFGKVKVGDHVGLEFEGGVKREGVVSAVDPVINAETFRVKLEVNNADAQIPAGLSVTWTWQKK